MPVATPINPPSQEGSSPKPELDYKHFREEHKEPLGELWDDNALLSNNFMTLAKESAIIPHADIQLPILTAYALIPSAMASIAPILYLFGDRGSGKSTATVLISAVQGCPIKSAATTFAALRTEFNKMRWHVPETCEGEKNCCLLFDNVNRETLLNEQLYTMLLNGYNRKTDEISISKGNGETMVFKVFGLKVMSSIHNFFSQAKFSELARRCIVIKFKPFERMTPNETEWLKLESTYNIVERLELEGLDLSILHKSFIEFWENPSNLLNYTSVKRKLVARKKSFVIPDVIDGSRWTISVDLICSGIVTGVWNSIDNAIEVIAKYWEWYELNIASAYGATHKILKDFIEDETKKAREVNESLGYEAALLEVNPERLKKHINWASSQGMLDITPTPSVIANCMADIGWQLDKGSHGQICWIPALN